MPVILPSPPKRKRKKPARPGDEDDDGAINLAAQTKRKVNGDGTKQRKASFGLFCSGHARFAEATTHFCSLQRVCTCLTGPHPLRQGSASVSGMARSAVLLLCRSCAWRTGNLSVAQRVSGPMPCLAEAGTHSMDHPQQDWWREALDTCIRVHTK